MSIPLERKYPILKIKIIPGKINYSTSRLNDKSECKFVVVCQNTKLEKKYPGKTV